MTPPRSPLPAPVARRLWRILSPYRRTLLGASIALALATGLQLAVAPLVGELVSALKGGPSAATLEPLLRVAVFIVAVSLGRAAAVFVQGMLLTRGLQRLGVDLRARVVAHALRLPHAFHDEGRSGDLLASLTSDVPALQGHLAAAITDVVAAPLMLVGGVIYLFILNWQLALLLLACLPVTAVLIRVAGRLQRRYQARVQATQASVLALVAERVAGIRTIKAFGREAQEVERLRAENAAALRAVGKCVRIHAAAPPVIEVIGAVAFVLVLGFAGFQIVQGTPRVHVETLAVLIIVLERISNAARQAGHISMNLGQAAATAERLFAFLDQTPAIRDRPGARALGGVEGWRSGRMEEWAGPDRPSFHPSTRPSVHGEVEFDRVTFGYVPERPVLREVTFRVSPGELVAVVGRSGMGKSTLLSLLPRFYEVSQGCVRIDGTDLRDVTLASLRENIAIVPQEVHLFSGTVADNLRYGCPTATAEQLEAAARAANAHNFIRSLPQGYETEVGEGGARLSGGQRQRIAIARALLKDAPILLLDEATASLDSESEALVQEALGRLMRGRTTLVIAHRLSTIRHAHRILVIDEGRVVETGTHQELVSQGGVYSALHATQNREAVLAG